MVSSRKKGDDENMTRPHTTNFRAWINEKRKSGLLSLLCGSAEVYIEPSDNEISQSIAKHLKLELCESLIEQNCAPTVVPHVRQRKDWDCGIACIQMVGAWLNPGETSHTESWEALSEEMATESIWTADLVVVLHRLVRRHDWPLSILFCSRTPDFNESLSDLSYYKSSFNCDRSRVAGRFQSIRDFRIPVLESELSIHDVVSIVSQPNVVAIALIDNSVWKQRGISYAGHYVLILGVVSETSDNDRGTSFLLHNPASDNSPVLTSLLEFERCWEAEGTDKDIIFLAK